jgi:hypothetical protein
VLTVIAGRPRQAVRTVAPSRGKPCRGAEGRPGRPGKVLPRRVTNDVAPAHRLLAHAKRGGLDILPNQLRFPRYQRLRTGPDRKDGRPTAVSPDDRRSGGRDHGPATTHPVLSINIRRELATVVVTLEGLLDHESSPALVALLWDLVVGQGNLSVAIDARRLTLSDPALIWIFRVLERQAAVKGGTLAVVEESLLSASTEHDVTAAALDRRRARRVTALGKAAHPAGGAGSTPGEQERSQP